MSLDLHTVSLKKGGSMPSDLAKLSLALLLSVAIPGPVGEATAGVLLNPGAGFTSIPTAAAADGSGATLGISMSLGTTAAAAPGATYAPNDTITMTGGTASTQALLEVLTTKAVTAPAVAAGGTLYAVGDNITLQNGMVVQVATLSGSAVASVTIVNGGSFTANNTTAGGLTQVSTTGAGSGATFTMTAAKYGVNTYAVQNAGLYSVLPSSPVSQGSTSGSGTGFQLTVSTWVVGQFTALGGQAYKNGSAITTTGGGGTTQATGQVVTNPIGEAIQVNVPMTIPAGGAVCNVTPNGPCLASTNGKSLSGFNVLLTPRSTSEPVLASAFDALVIH
jgi:hypothetical protein